MTNNEFKRKTVEIDAIGCSRCLLTNKIPGVLIKKDGLCSVCDEHDRKWGNFHKTEKERLAVLDKILESARKKNRLYDVLVPISGGKDSIYTLYLLRKKYKLKCLAVTFDNCFLTDLARENIKNACEILEVDHIYYGLSKPHLMKLYRYFFLKTGFFCPICMRGIYVTHMRAQIAFNIPLAVKGSSHRTEEHISSEYFLPGEINFIENVLEDSGMKNDSELLLIQAGFIRSLPTIQLPDYIDWNYKEVFETIKNKLKWMEEKDESEHSDCRVTNIVDYIRFRKFPALIPGLLRFSKLITCNQMMKEEAVRKLSCEIEEMHEPENLKWFLNELGISQAEMDEVLEDPMRHMKYLKKHSPVLRRIKALEKKRIRLV
jgi:hypothetical protein